MNEFISNHQIFFILMYGISMVLLLLCYILEKKITVLELLVSWIVFLIPVLNVMILLYTLLDILLRNDVINVQKWKDSINNFLNYRIK